MFGLVIGAGILGIIIAMMEQGEFPGWGKMIICVLAAGIPAAWGMSVKRAWIAAGICLAIQAAISTVFYFRGMGRSTTPPAPNVPHIRIG
jgi:hypothetical protein